MMGRKTKGMIQWVPVLVVALAFILGAVPLAAQDKSPETWQWEVTPYAWGPSMDGKITIGDQYSAQAHVSLSNILNNLQFAFFGHVEARYDRWGLFIDPIYTSLGKTGHTPDGLLKIDTDFDMFVTDVGAYYRIYKGEKASFDFLFGGRYNDASIHFNFTPYLPSRHASQHYWQPLWGFRYNTMMGERWFFQVRADWAGVDHNSGMGWGAAVRFDFRMTKKVAWLTFGYLYMHTEDEGGSGYSHVDYSVNVGGPTLGVAFKF